MQTHILPDLRMKGIIRSSPATVVTKRIKAMVANIPSIPAVSVVEIAIDGFYRRWLRTNTSRLERDDKLCSFFL